MRANPTRPWWRRPLGRLRVVGWCEGVSFVALLGIAMPLKYLADRPMAVTVVGGLHGALFVAYGLVLIDAALDRSWGWGRVVGLGLAAVLPFGPFVADARVLRELDN